MSKIPDINYIQSRSWTEYFQLHRTHKLGIQHLKISTTTAALPEDDHLMSIINEVVRAGSAWVGMEDMTFVGAGSQHMAIMQVTRPTTDGDDAVCDMFEKAKMVVGHVRTRFGDQPSGLKVEFR